MAAEQDNAVDLPILESFKESLNSFLANVEKTSSAKNTPKWFSDFKDHLVTFSNDFLATIMKLEKQQIELESKLGVQKAVTDGLSNERVRLNERIADLEEELEDLNNYTRRTNLLFHGLEEEKDESTDDKILGILKDKLGLPLTINDIGRSHRLGRSVQGKKRPIIVRFATYRQRKMAFDAKRKLKGSKTVITENLTKCRYALFKLCQTKYGWDKVWTLDNRIYCLTGKKNQNGLDQRIVVTKEKDMI